MSTTVNMDTDNAVQSSEPDSGILLQAVATMHSRRKHPSTTVDTGGNLQGRSFVAETDSGYSSMSNTPNDGSSDSMKGIEYSAASRKLWPRKTTKLRPFNQDIPESTKHRFDDLKELFDKPLYDHLMKSSGRFSAVSMKLKVLGQAEQTAKPWIVVFCDKSVAKKVKQFFNQPLVKEELKPSEHNSYLPCFDLVVYAEAPRPIAAWALADVFGEIEELGTLCGASIAVRKDNHIRAATLGGVIIVSTPESGDELYGMTAGHVLREYIAVEREGVSNESAGIIDAEDEDYLTDGNEEFELDLSTEESLIPPPLQSSPMPQAVPSQRIGELFLFAREDEQDQQNLDWALVSLDRFWSYRPNEHFMHAGDLKGPKRVERVDTCCVDVLTSSGGVKRGILSASSSYLMLSPGKSFVETYTLVMPNNSGLIPGDCGSWVVDILTNEVYGHVIAVDSFGEAYVIPLQATFEQIERRVGAHSVRLAGSQDIKDYQTKRLEAYLPADATPLSPSEIDSGYSSMDTSPIVVLEFTDTEHLEAVWRHSSRLGPQQTEQEAETNMETL